MKVLFLPDWRRSNPYQDLLADSVRAEGHQVDFSDFPDAVFPLQHLLRSHAGTEVFHLHWINQLIGPAVWSKNPLKRWVRLALMRIDVMLARLRGVKVIWTVHNFTSHDSAEPAAEIHARSALARAVSHVVVHSHGALEKLRQGWGAAGLGDGRVSVIRHGNFDDCYPEDAEGAARLREAWAPQPGTVVVLFFGAVRPYKGLESLIHAFSKVVDPRLRLVIAGKPNTPEFGEQLRLCATQDRRIIPCLEFISDDAVAAYYRAADVVAIPLKQTLTSGSAVLAMTMGKPLIMPASTRHLDLGGTQCVLHYENESEFIALLATLHEFEFDAMGRACADAARAWSWSEVGHRTALTYSIS